MTSINESDIQKGQVVYTPFMLWIYDVWVLDISNSWIWRCPKRIQQDQFNRYVKTNHLDIGVGTGYYLRQCKWPAQARLSLMDLNPNCLDTAKRRLQEQEPAVYQADIFKPQDSLAGQFDSVSMNYLLHCLPGNMNTKSVAIATAVSMLKEGGTLFGATILSDAHLHTKTSQRLCDFYNSKQIFSNQHDTLQALKLALSQHLNNIEVSVVGCVALFKGAR